MEDTLMAKAITKAKAKPAKAAKAKLAKAPKKTGRK